ncbi:GNAT family N-acetyltransferase [Jidongwangia harbinensis]|uniref:GNAT family N-acetyltransferase n=1 Tax=Jidongwangia harbinensis TaxID=2878561 RepID=UPI001CDA4825|nr:GNAT family N-acetyltransferase [Jidongwangia harbinensis]MCA2213631.1 GNAT family N-acetyltransferase [Jidongwangia harbinensis]
MQIDVASFGDTDESAARHAHDIFCAANLARTPDMPVPSFRIFRDEVYKPFPGVRKERAIGYLDGEPAGYLLIMLPQQDNLDNASIELYVHPRHRRRGVGRAVHAWAVQRIRALGRKRLNGETVQNEDGSDAFAAAMGASAALAETRSRLDVTASAQPRWDAMLAEAWTHADGYRFVRWEGVPPERYLDDVAYLDSRLNADAPTGDLDLEPEKVDADRVRRTELQRRDRGFRRFHGGIEHVATGRLVAWTVLAGHPDNPDHLWQNITLVDPPHRGHRLGLVVKLENLRYAREHWPALAAIDTWNASSNEHMLAINVAMGFRPVDSWMQWQQTV